MSEPHFPGVSEEFCRFYAELVPHLHTPNAKTVVYYRKGDFYVALGEPAAQAVRALALVPTGYHKLLAIHAFPLHAVDAYIDRLTRAKMTVVVIYVSEPPT